MASSKESAMRSVDLVGQISLRLMHGFDIAPEDIAEAEELGIDVDEIRRKVGACYESAEEE